MHLGFILFFLFSYKEDSDDETDSDDLIEHEGPVEDAPVDDSETIEKVVRHKQGWPGCKIYFHHLLNPLRRLTRYPISIIKLIDHLFCS